MVVLPPGTLLQLMYLDERLRNLDPGRFIEIGAGSGEVVNRLLRAGWCGTAYDLSEETATTLAQRFAREIAHGSLQIVQGDFLSSQPSRADVDLIVSSMVIEHLDQESERRFMDYAAHALKPGGRMIGLVPGCPERWGIEDEIAGHCRRYTRDSLTSMVESAGWRIEHLAGLTFPLSNLLLPLSNHLVRRSEAPKLALTALERTRQSGHRRVRFKTHFPEALRGLLNEASLRPFHWLQKAFVRSRRPLVLYFEAVADNRQRGLPEEALPSGPGSRGPAYSGMSLNRSYRLKMRHR